MKVAVKRIAIFALLTVAVGLSVPAFAQSPPQPSLYGTAASVAGSSWNVIETDGDKDIFTFMADGSLHYWDGKKDYANGTWKQDGDSIYIEMNNKFCEYQGRITGTHMEGKAWNVKGKNWTWVADTK